METFLTIAVALAFGLGVIGLYLLSTIRVLNEYERGVIFRLGRLMAKPKGPGLILAFGPIDRKMRVDLRTITKVIEPQEVITRDNVSVWVNRVLDFRVVDPMRSVRISGRRQTPAGSRDHDALPNGDANALSPNSHRGRLGAQFHDYLPVTPRIAQAIPGKCPGWRECARAQQWTTGTVEPGCEGAGSVRDGQRSGRHTRHGQVTHSQRITWMPIYPEAARTVVSFDPTGFSTGTGLQ